MNAFTDNIMLELALLIGVVHICLSLMRSVGRNWAAAGWILAIIGAYLYIPHYLNVTSMTQFVFGINRDAAAATGGYLFVLGVPLGSDFKCDTKPVDRPAGDHPDHPNFQRYIILFAPLRFGFGGRYHQCDDK